MEASTDCLQYLYLRLTRIYKILYISFHETGEFRVVFIAKFPEAVYVLHAFQKKTQKTPKKDIALAQQRLKQLEQERRHLS